jgi:hypothetical protein
MTHRYGRPVLAKGDFFSHFGGQSKREAELCVEDRLRKLH